MPRHSCTATVTQTARSSSSSSITLLPLSRSAGRSPSSPPSAAKPRPRDASAPSPPDEIDRRRKRAEPSRRRRRRPSPSRPRESPASSRLLFLLLHLVGVSTDLPRVERARGGLERPGIAGRRARSTRLQRLDLSGLAARRGGGPAERARDSVRADALREPLWFQDGESSCLGPGRFGDCGDAFLWRMRRRDDGSGAGGGERGGRRGRNEKKKRRQQRNQQHAQGDSREESTVCVWPFFCERSSRFAQKTENEANRDAFDTKDEDGFALELVDVDDYAFGHNSFSKQRHRQKRRRRARFLWLAEVTDGAHPEPECLVSRPSEGPSLRLGSCASEEAWAWHINEDGVLIRGLTASERRKASRRRWIGSPIGYRGSLLHSDPNAETEVQCVHKVNGTGAALFPCNGDKTREQPDENERALVGFSLVRFPYLSTRQLGHSSSGDEWSPWVTMEGASAKQSKSEPTTRNTTTQSSTSNSSDRHISSRTSSQNHASNAKQRHVEVKSTSSMLHTGLDQGSARKARVSARTSASHIRDAPTAAVVQGGAFPVRQQNRASGGSGDKSTQQSSLVHREKPHRKHPMKLGETEAEKDAAEMTHHRPIKIPVHPYIKASKDEIWVDPLTSLEYPTDLCRYLGQTKKEAGRHTLMGVGQYYRTAFNIKVYGAALYVAKRDVLADPKFIKYATLTAEELQKRDDFYEHLMNMPAQGEDPMSNPGGFFDRTLMVKTNMQLSTDAMRKSLEADWSLLTDEMKSLIIESSFRERMADERMLEKIKSKENSSNCSCGQTAPEEYGAEPSCCARGTELVFTWRKNGDFEIRLDGRVMDIFPRPDMAKGIFSEYLNSNPISLDAKSHFADGFPFLLAPLAQVKGMSSTVPITHDAPKKLETHSTGNPMFRLFDLAMHSVDTMNTHAHTLSIWMQDGAAEISSTLDDALGSAVGVARGFSAEFERHRMDMLDNALAWHEEISSLISSSVDEEEGSTALALVGKYGAPTFAPSSWEASDDDNNQFSTEIPDEIGVELVPTMNLSHWLCFITVHCYLVLLFVVSLQYSYTTKVVKRKVIT